MAGKSFDSHYGPMLTDTLLNRHSVVDRQDSRTLALNMRDRLYMMPTYAVTKTMGKVIEIGASEMSNLEVPEDFDMSLPSPSGFVWLEEPQMFPLISMDLATGDITEWGNTAPVAGIFWFTSPDGVGVHLPDGSRGIVPGIMSGVIMHRDLATQDAFFRDMYPEYITFDLTAWALNMPWREVSNEYWVEHHDIEPGIITPSGSFWRRWLLSFWALANDHITVTSASRPTIRRAKRAIGPTAAPDYGDVRVIALRRRTIPHEDHVPQETEVAWSHRWVVGGHWRWQPFGKGRKLRRWQWISPYEKGPVDKPLIIRDDVRVLKR